MIKERAISKDHKSCVIVTRLTGCNISFVIYILGIKSPTFFIATINFS